MTIIANTFQTFQAKGDREDLTDVIWWRELQLETRAVVGKDGRFLREAPAWLATDEARSAYEQFAGKAISTQDQLLQIANEVKR